jgi:hypothetical protein
MRRCMGVGGGAVGRWARGAVGGVGWVVDGARRCGLRRWLYLCRGMPVCVRCVRGGGCGGALHVPALWARCVNSACCKPRKTKRHK